MGRQQDFCLECLGPLQFQQKPSLKILVVQKGVQSPGEVVYTCDLFARGSQILIQQVSQNSILNDLPECYKNSASFKKLLAILAFNKNVGTSTGEECGGVTSCQEPRLTLGKVKQAAPRAYGGLDRLLQKSKPAHF